MSNTQPVEVGLRITKALDWAHLAEDQDLRPHYLQAVAQLTAEVHLTDLTTDELIHLTAVLIPAHSRVLAGRPVTAPTGRVLHLAPRGESTAN